jgi:hypothetical protein
MGHGTYLNCWIQVLLRFGVSPQEYTPRIDIDGVSLFVEPVKDHQFLLVIRGDGLHP